MPARKIPLADRFEAKVDKAGPTQSHMSTCCYVWTGAKFKPTKYGALQVNGKAERAHRVAWQLSNGTIPAGLDVLHKCDNEACVRVSHLYLGTSKDNARDRVVRGRAARGLRHGSVTKPGRLPSGLAHFLNKNPERVRGELNGNSKISEATARAILSEYDGSYGEIPRLVKKYNSSRSLIEQLVQGRTWRHLSRATVVV